MKTPVWPQHYWKVGRFPLSLLQLDNPHNLGSRAKKVFDTLKFEVNVDEYVPENFIVSQMVWLHEQQMEIILNIQIFLLNRQFFPAFYMFWQNF